MSNTIKFIIAFVLGGLLGYLLGSYTIEVVEARGDYRANTQELRGGGNPLTLENLIRHITYLERQETQEYNYASMGLNEDNIYLHYERGQSEILQDLVQWIDSRI